MGVLWLVNLGWKLPPDFGRDEPEGLLYSFERAADHAVIGPLRSLAEDVLIPHFTAFGWLVFVIELAAGVLLLLGLWSRLGAALGLAQAIAITLLVVDAPNEWLWGYLMFVAIHLVLLLTPAGERLSLDAWRRRW
jgi:uncharacterized membrane protein YphA (DoxX/SURF4 family)